jgi:tetratricopeptide (TPR) repeat protein
MRAYERARGIDPSAPAASNNLAWMQAERNQNLDEALAMAKAAAARIPDSPEIADTVGFVYMKKQLPSLALPEFQRSIDKDPKNPIYHHHLGLALAALGQNQKARQAFEEALRLNPQFEGADEARRTLSILKS